MRVVVVGGGPAGLYAAVLLRRAAGCDVTVVEARPADKTFGWGVVFSDATLAALREADPMTHDAITSSFVRWTAIEVRYGGNRLRSGGHAFAGLSRRRLLGILQDRCAQLGVRLEFEHEVTDLAAAAEGADLLIGADGVRSVVRAAAEEVFAPRIDERRSKYVWYGTNLLLDAFTFVFRDSPHGLFTVHAYPYDGEHATFIVETSPETWRAAGLDGMDEAESIAFCEELFADVLRGARLLSNASRWISFGTLRTRTWSYWPRHPDAPLGAPTVLLGDAAHTAHFSVGSGTKLAMEDAVALARAVAEQPDPVAGLPTALRRYELERRPAVERLQEAAQDSLEYFEQVARYRGQAPLQFSTGLLTRSGRITFDGLRVRDADFTGDVERWFAGAPGALAVPPPPLVPLALRGCTLSSRLAVAPIVEVAADDGDVEDAWAASAASAADGAPALVVLPPAAVSRAGRATAEDPGLWDDRHTAWLTRVVAEVRQRSPDTLVAAVLGHAGRRGATRPRRDGLDRPLREGWPLVAPAALPYTARSSVPTVLDEAGQRGLVEAFAAAATRAADAGADVVVVDAADGGLLASWLSPLTNPAAADRLAFPTAVLAAVRAAWPPDRPLALRLTVDDLAAGGNTIDDGVAAAAVLVTSGVDLLEVRAGFTVPTGRFDYRPGRLVRLADVVRNAVGVATMAGGITSIGEAATALAAGRVDVAILER